MAYSRFRTGVALRAVALALTIVAVACMIAQTRWYVTITLVLAVALAQIVALVRLATQSSREVARFLDAISFDDTSQSFSRLLADSAHSELGLAMTRVLTQLRLVRSEREEQARYFQALIAHAPVALISTDERGGVKLLNMAAPRLFWSTLAEIKHVRRHAYAVGCGIETIR